jgi:hypothetical protein
LYKVPKASIPVHCNDKYTLYKNSIQLITTKQAKTSKTCAWAFSLTIKTWYLTLESEETANKKYPTATSDANSNKAQHTQS